MLVLAAVEHQVLRLLAVLNQDSLGATDDHGFLLGHSSSFGGVGTVFSIFVSGWLVLIQNCLSFGYAVLFAFSNNFLGTVLSEIQLLVIE